MEPLPGGYSGMNTPGASVPSSLKAPNYRADREHQPSRYRQIGCDRQNGQPVFLFESMDATHSMALLGPALQRQGGVAKERPSHLSSGERRGKQTRATLPAKSGQMVWQLRARCAGHRALQEITPPSAGVAPRLARFIPSPAAHHSSRAVNPSGGAERRAGRMVFPPVIQRPALHQL